MAGDDDVVDQGDAKFQEDLREAGITVATRDVLVANGFDTRQALSVLELSDVAKIGVKPLAQKRLLERLIRRLASGEATTSANTTTTVPATPDSEPVAGPSRQSARLDTLGSTASVTTEDRTGEERGAGASSAADPLVRTGDMLKEHLLQAKPSINDFRGDLDPLVYLAETKTPDCYQIVDFVPTSCSEREERVISSHDGSELVIKSGPKKLSLGSVSPMQWTAANAKILARLLQEGKLAIDKVGLYLAYTVKIAGLAQRYTWQSVLNYDMEYRKAQSLYKFPWGSDVPHLVFVHLVHKSAQPVQSGKKTPGSSEKPVMTCRLYNHSSCVYGQKCKYRHACVTCDGPHPLFEHSKADKSGSKP